MDFEKELNYWIEQAQLDLHCFPNDEAMNSVKGLFKLFNANNQLKWYCDKDRKGIMVYSILPDFRGGMCVNELFMYIKPEHRGSIKLFKELVNHLEQVAKETNCGSVRIASNIGYDDQKVLRVLKIFGYETDVVVKYMR